MSNIVINKVYLEDDLSVFKIITGNRTVEPARVKKIKGSIKTIGMIDAPIVCNEKMEVIDGQGRLQACRELGKPVPYIIVQGLTIDHCRAMNLNQTNWSGRDYIRSYASEGNENYIRLEDFISASKFTYSIAIDVALNCYCSNATESIVSGGVTFSEEDQKNASIRAAWLHQFDGVKTNNRRLFYCALRFCFNCPEINKDILSQKIVSCGNEFTGISKIYDGIKTIELVYNKRARNHVYIQHLYDVWLNERGVNNALRHSNGSLLPDDED